MRTEALDDAERSVLAAMLNSGDAVDDAAALITGRDFRNANYGEVFDAIARLHAAGEPHDVVSVGTALGSRLDRLGGMAALWEINLRVVSTASASHYAGIVLDGSRMRAIVQTGSRLQQMGEAAEADPLEVINQARAEIDALVVDDDTDSVPNERAVFDALESLDNPPGDPTPWPQLTKVLAGWKRQAFYIVGARTSVGKSVIALNATLDMARRGKRAVLFSLEMSRDEVYLRMLSHVGRVDGGRIQRRELRAEDYQKLSDAAAHIATLPITVDDRAGLSIAQIRSKVRTIQRKEEIGLVVVDYLGKVRPPSEYARQDRRIQVDAIAWGHKEISRELDVPVVAMSQLNRNIEGRAEKMPTLSDLRESGGQEQDADVVILMHRALNEQYGDPSSLHLHVAKNRHGQTASMELVFRGHYSTADDPDPWNERNAS